MATGAAGLSHSRLFYITDRVSAYRFLIDTGAEVSVVPPSPAERQQHCTDFSLVAVNGVTIHTYGKRSLTLNVGLRRTFRWVFVIANVQFPIIGADFLHHYSLLVDMTNSRLVDATTHLRVQGILSQAESPSPTFFHHNMLHPLQLSLRNIQLFSNHTSAAILSNMMSPTIYVLMVPLSMHDHGDWLLRS